MYFIWGGGGGAVCFLEELWGCQEATAACLSGCCDKKKGVSPATERPSAGHRGDRRLQPRMAELGLLPSTGRVCDQMPERQVDATRTQGFLTILSEPGPPYVHLALGEPSSGGSHHSLATSLGERCPFARAHLHWECPRTGPALLHRDQPPPAPRNT